MSVVEGNLYPTDGSVFAITEPSDQQAEKDRQKAEVFSNIKFINDLIERFDQRVKKYESVNGVEVDLAEDPALHQKKMFIAQELAKVYRAEKAELEELIKDL